MGAAPILTVLKGGETLRLVPLESEAVVGRGEGCVIRLEDRAISREHALFRRVGDSVQVEKKSEFGPLIVNGSECTTAVLKEGDVIAIGPYQLRLSLQSQSGAAAAPPRPPIVAPPPVAEAPSAPAPAPLPPAVEPAPLAQALAVEPPQGDATAGVDIGAGSNGLGLDLDSPGGGEGSEGSPDELEIDSDVLNSASRGPEISTGSGATRPLDQGHLQVRLVFKPGDANVTELPISQNEISIGRGKDCDIILNDKKASRRNSVIVREGLRFILRDLGSANGTCVNGEKITEKELVADDRILIGDVEFGFQALQAGYEERARDFIAVPHEEPVPDMGIGGDNQFAIDPGALPDIPDGPLGIPGDGGAQVTGVAFDPASPFGIAGVNKPGAGKKDSLIDKFKRQPMIRKVGIVVALAALVFWLMNNDEDGQKAKKANDGKKPVAGATGASGATGGSGQTGPQGPKTADQRIAELAFNSLSPEQKRFIEAQHDLAFTYFKNKDYDKALFEIGKVFSLVQDYKDSREIERYAKEGKRKLEAMAEEKRKKEEAELKRKIGELVDNARERMEQKKYQEASDLFTQILALDPENAAVSAWQKQLQAIEEEKKIEAQKKEIREQINKEAWDVFGQARQLQKKGKYHSAIRVYKQIAEMGASDERVAKLAKKEIGRCYGSIARILDPMLKEGKKAEDDGDFVKAIQLYEKALAFEPGTSAAELGIGRLRGILHDRAKVLYTEAILAESYSDFATAQKKYKECLTTAPHEDIYHDRAQRKLSHYFRQEQETPTP